MGTPWAACYGEMFYARTQWWELRSAARHYGTHFEGLHFLESNIQLDAIPYPLIDHAGLGMIAGRGGLVHRGDGCARLACRPVTVEHRDDLEFQSSTAVTDEK